MRRKHKAEKTEPEGRPADVYVPDKSWSQTAKVLQRIRRQQLNRQLHIDAMRPLGAQCTSDAAVTALHLFDAGCEIAIGMVTRKGTVNFTLTQRRATELRDCLNRLLCC